MKILRRLLGILVMIAGVIGLLISLAGLVGVWWIRPVLTSSINSTITTLNNTIDTSNQVMGITAQALGATIESVNGLSDMLKNTGKSVEDTKPVMNQVNSMVGITLPETMKSTTDSLKAAQVAAASLESAIKSLDSFKIVLSATPFLSGLVDNSSPPYNPEKPLAVSLGEVARELEGMPTTFTKMAADLDQADNNLDTIQTNLNTMSSSVSRISISLGEYQAMIGQSQASMTNLKMMLTTTQANLGPILNITAAVLTLFFLWLLAAQVVIFSQGLELFHGTADRMDTGVPRSESAEVPSV